MAGMTKLTWGRAAAALFAMTALTAAGCGDSAESCSSESGMEICGDIGSHLYSLELPGSGDVQWPPVAMSDGRLMLARGDAVIEVAKDGTAKKAARFNAPLSVLAHDKGRIIAVTNDWSASVVAWDGATADDNSPISTWWQPTGDALGTAPVTIGDGRVALTTTGNGTDGPSWTWTPRQAQVEIRDGDNGKLLVKIPGAAAPTLMPDGSYRVIKTEDGCGHYRFLAKLDANAKEIWAYEEHDGGIVDYAPSADGRVFAVTANRNLRAISADGKLLWSFTPDCPKCTVAAAPTVTAGAIYFPVWVGAGQWQCNDNPWSNQQQGYDPLFALTHDGKLLWSYDGFHSARSHFNPTGLMPMSPTGGPVIEESSQHHPAGRPTIAEDGTIYVAADGALVALSKNGAEVGRVLMKHSLGEMKTNTNSPHYGRVTEHDTGVHAPPVLGPNRPLYTRDRPPLHPINTRRKLAPPPWIAPFGGADNNGRVAR